MHAPLTAVAIHAQEVVTAFVGVSVIPMDRERVLENQTVVVRGQKVVALGSFERTKIPASAVRIDGHGKYLLPGLADMHTHLLGVGRAGHDSATTELMLFALAAHGVTTVRNMDYWPTSIQKKTAPLLHWRARAAAGELWAPRIYTAGMWYSDPTRSVTENVAAYKRAGYDFIKVHDEDPSLYLVDSLGNPDLIPTVTRIDSLVAAARRAGLSVAGHAVGSINLAGDMAYGLKHHFASFEHLHGFPGITGWPGDTLEIPALVSATRHAGVWICPINRLPEWRDSAPEPAGPVEKAYAQIVRLRRRVTKALYDAGVGLLLGTDTPALGLPGASVHKELQGFVSAGLTPYQALLTGTRNVAEYFGTEGSTGTIAVGKRADLILLNENPLVDIRNSSSIVGVMAGGHWLADTEIERRMKVYAQANESLRSWFAWP